MNAAARELSESNFFTGQWSDIRMSRTLFLKMALVFIVLINALAVVYVTNSYRLTQSELQLAEQQSNQLELQWGQLLLEQASLATPARVESLAQEKLHMVLPNSKETIVLRAQ